jgi:hypothetical protein
MESRHQGAFHELFLFHDGISTIKEPYHELFLFHDGISAIKKPFHKLFLFDNGISAIKEPFHTMKFTKCMNWGKTLYIYIYIYITKSIYTGLTSLKTLPLDLEPPLQGKEYGPSYSNEIAKKKANVLFLKSLIDS